jgi:methyltransferase-like protein 6
MKTYENVSLFQVDEKFVSEAECTLSALPAERQEVSDFWKEKYEKEHAKFWDLFYKNNKTNFFKDRHYLEREFELEFPDEEVLFVEMGCGVGNALVPLVERHAKMKGVGIDCSKNAIDLLNARGLGERCRGFVMDMTSEELSSEDFNSLTGKVDYVSLIFSLSACHPKTHKTVVENIKKLLKPGGVVMLRDYAKYDLAQLRFAEKQAKLDEDFYVRGDGTKAKFFSEEEVKQLFAFDMVNMQLKLHAKKFVNRKDNLEMHRLWIQGVWKFQF